MKNFINFLPPWVETNMQPAFYDKESGAVIQQTARMYAKVNQLVRIANEQYRVIQDYINKFNELKDYVDEYFENLDVQEEINNKLNSMAEDGSLQEILQTILTEPLAEMRSDIDEFESSVNSTVSAINNKVSSAIGSTPIAVDSLSDMTDTTKVYVLTTSGHWYYYDGDSWEDGGTYQSTGLADASVARSNLNFTHNTKQMFDVDNPTIINAISLNGNPFQASAYSVTVIVPVEPSTFYTMQRGSNGTRFTVYETNALPDVGVSVIATHGDSTETTTRMYAFTTNANTHYLAIFAYNRNADVGLTYEDIYSSLMVSKTAVPIDWQPYKGINLNNADYEKTIGLRNITSATKTYQLLDSENVFAMPILINENNQFYASANSRVIVLPCKSSTTYTVKKFISTDIADRLCVFSCVNFPKINDYATEVEGVINPSTTTHLEITTGDSDKYLCIFAYNANANPDTTLQEVADNLLVYEGDDTLYDTNIPYYTLPVSVLNMTEPTIESTAIKISDEDLCDLSFINSITACGDSYTNCGVWQNGGWRGGSLETSWIGMLGKKNGIKASKCAQGGVTTRTFQTDANCLTKALSEEPADLYYLALGINDCIQYGTSYIGQDSDINDDNWTINSDTFYGNYGKIIQQLKNHAPNARFVMITVMRPDSMNPNYSTFSNAIKGIANHYGFPVIEPIKDQAFSQSVLTYLQSNHPTYAGWNAISRIIERQTSKVINDNMSYFDLINL